MSVSRMLVVAPAILQASCTVTSSDRYFPRVSTYLHFQSTSIVSTTSVCILLTNSMQLGLDRSFVPLIEHSSAFSQEVDSWR